MSTSKQKRHAAVQEPQRKLQLGLIIILKKISDIDVDKIFAHKNIGPIIYIEYFPNQACETT